MKCVATSIHITVRCTANSFAGSFSSSGFGFGEGQTFCTKFANNVIRAGGGNIPSIQGEIQKYKARLIKDIGMSLGNLKKVVKKSYVPTPANYSKKIKSRFREHNINSKAFNSDGTAVE